MCLFEEPAFALEEGAAYDRVSATSETGLPRLDRMPAASSEAYTERLRSSLMALISIFRRPMLTGGEPISTSAGRRGHRDDGQSPVRRARVCVGVCVYGNGRNGRYDRPRCWTNPSRVVARLRIAVRKVRRVGLGGGSYTFRARSGPRPAVAGRAGQS